MYERTWRSRTTLRQSTLHSVSRGDDAAGCCIPFATVFPSASQTPLLQTERFATFTVPVTHAAPSSPAHLTRPQLRSVSGECPTGRAYSHDNHHNPSKRHTKVDVGFCSWYTSARRSDTWGSVAPHPSCRNERKSDSPTKSALYWIPRGSVDCNTCIIWYLSCHQSILSNRYADSRNRSYIETTLEWHPMLCDLDEYIPNREGVTMAPYLTYCDTIFTSYTPPMYHQYDICKIQLLLVCTING